MNIFSAALQDVLIVFVAGYAAGVISAWVIADVSSYYRSGRE
jgi:hypothetical protein